MHVGRICSKETIAVGPDDPISLVAQHMRENHVGAVEASTSLAAVGDLETEYATNWAFFGDELGTIQDELELCDLADGMQAHLDETQAAIDTMVTEMSDHAEIGRASCRERVLQVV